MNFDLLIYGSAEYLEMVDLRYKVLRESLGLTFSEQDLADEVNDIFCVCRDAGRIVGCCILVPQNDGMMKLRQMAVAPDMQGRGIGRLILDFAEKTAKERGFYSVVLHARKVATGFYAKYGYTISGNYFTEVGIPHVKMKKRI